MNSSKEHRRGRGLMRLPKFLWNFASDLLEMLSYLPVLSQIRIETVEIEDAAIPASFDGYTLAAMADLHGHAFGRGQKRLLQAIQSIHPDAILMAGDWVRLDYDGKDKKAIDELIQGALSIAPFYGSMGNHEYYAPHRQDLTSALEESGGRMLVDETYVITRPNPVTKEAESIGITGLNTYYEEMPYEVVVSEFREALRNYRTPISPEQEPIYRVVLGHRPELLPVYGALGMNLVISGHAHGGLMRLMGGRRLLAPDQGLWPTLTHGVHKRHDTTMVITEGLGGPRIFIRPQVIRLVLHTAKERTKQE